MGIAQNNSDPLAPLVPPDIQVTTLNPKVGALSKGSWRINSFDGNKAFSYTPKKAGNETLTFFVNSPKTVLQKDLAFPVINCRYKVSIHSEIFNSQGGIKTNIFYDGEGHIDLVRNGKEPVWTIVGYGTTNFEGFSDGTEGDVTCVTASSAKGAGTFRIEGEAVPTVRLNPVFHFRDVGGGVGLSCRRGKDASSGSIRRIAWLPNSSQQGVLKDLEFTTNGDNKELPISAVDDKRWLEGANQGTMLVTLLPETR